MATIDSTPRICARTRSRSRSQQLRLVGQTFNIDPNLINVLQECKKAVEVSIPISHGRRLDQGVHRATASSTTSPAARPRAASATTPTSRSTR